LAATRSYKIKKVLDQCRYHIGSSPYLTDQQVDTKSKCQNSLKEFTKYIWPVLAPNDFRDGFHIDAICEHLEALYRLEIQDLIINLPPRMAKSTICMVAYPCWVWLNDPSFSFLCTSYAETLSDRDSEACANVIGSDLYKDYWGGVFTLTTQSKRLIKTNKRGERRATTIGGGNTGLGSNLLMIDDPNNVRHADSTRIRDVTNDVIAYVLTTRYGLLENRRRLLTQQRCHPNDASGFVLANTLETWTHLMLPMEYEPHRKCSTVFLPKLGKVWEDPREEAGELLWPTGCNAEGVAKLKAGFRNRSFAIEAQLQQNPVLEKGGIFELDWFRVWRKGYDPKFVYILQSWDTAFLNNPDSCSNACTTWGVFEDESFTRHAMLLDIFSKQMEFPELRKTAIQLYEDWVPDMVVVEAKASGHSLKSELFHYNIPVVGFNPTKHGRKDMRARYAASFVEAGYVWVRGMAPHYVHVEESAQKLFEAARYFPDPTPGSDAPDIIDSVSQAIMKLEAMGILAHNQTLEPYVGEKSYDYESHV
jgi:hypothetical protein